MRQIVSLALAASVLAPAAAVAADGGPGSGRSKDLPMEVAAGASTVLYTPLKGLLCLIGGGAGGAAAFLSSGAQAARTVVNASCRGTWIITPEILKGERPLELVREQPCCGYPALP